MQFQPILKEKKATGKKITLERSKTEWIMKYDKEKESEQ